MLDYKKLKEQFEEIGIDKAIIYDDEIEGLSKQREIEIVTSLLEQVIVEDIDIEKVIEDMELDFFAVRDKSYDGDVDDRISNELKKLFPEKFETGMERFVKTCEDIFGDSNVSLLGKDTDFEKVTVEEHTIIFLDYQLDGVNPDTSEAFIKLLSQKDAVPPKSIIFISNRNEFTIDGDKYNMLELCEKSKYFIKLRKKQEEQNYKNSIYEYIHKSSLQDENNIIEELIRIKDNLRASIKYYGLLSNIENTLLDGSKKVVGKFHLLNARSMKEILIKKVEAEGEPESVFLMNWIARRISQTILRNKDMRNIIYSALAEIQEMEDMVDQLHEDEIIRDMIKEENWDTDVSKRYMPVEFGDIYEIEYNGRQRKAILISQPCSLAVRSNGTRSAKVATLILENEDMEGRKSTASILDWNNNLITFDFDESISYPIQLLDLTMLNEGGQAIIRIGSKPDEQEIILPDEPVFSKSYKNLFKNYSKKFVSFINLKPNETMYQINHMYFPFEKVSENTEILYKFPQIKRIAKLEQMKAIDILQQSQSFLGRIGHPVSINFMDDYKLEKINVKINDEDYGNVDIRVKRVGKSINDATISLDDLKDKILSIYNTNETICNNLCEILALNGVATFNYASGMRLLSLKNKKCLSILRNEGIFLCFNENIMGLSIKIGVISKCYFQEENITSLISDICFDTNGKLKFKIKRDLAERLGISNKREIQQYSEESEILTLRIEEDILRIDSHEISDNTKEMVSATL